MSIKNRGFVVPIWWVCVISFKIVKNYGIITQYITFLMVFPQFKWEFQKKIEKFAGNKQLKLKKTFEI